MNQDECDDLEGDAGLLLRRAGLNDDEPPSAAALCRGLLGTTPLLSRVPRGSSALVRQRDEWLVLVKRRTILGRARYAVGHELAHWWLEHQRKLMVDNLEELCGYLGAALVAPRRAYVAALRRHGLDPAALAEALRTTQSVALLRAGEVAGHAVALVKHGGELRVRGTWVWPPEPELRRAARHGGPGLRVVRIDDEAKRAGLVAA